MAVDAKLSTPNRSVTNRFNARMDTGASTEPRRQARSHGAAQTRPLALNSVFSIFSITKAFTNTLVLRAIELGQFLLTSRVSELIPEFSGFGR